MQRGTNRLTRDNAGRITSVGGDGATARGGRLRTASGKQRATVTAKGIGKAPAGTVGRSGKVKAPRQSDATVMGGTSRIPASQRPGSITNTLRGTLRSLAQADARRIREIESITGQPVRAPRRAPAGQGATVRAPGRRSISGTLGDNLRALAQSDARTARGMADLAKPSPAGAIKGGSSRKALKPAAAKPAATAKPARRRSRAASITPDKTKRITERINRVTAASSTKTGVKRLNSTEVSVRAKAFVTRKVGGMSGLQGKTFEQQQAAVKAALAKPNRYSTQKPNRNKPERYNNLGQSSLRRKAAAANKVTAGGSIGEGSRMAAQVNRSASIAASRAPSAPRLATRSAGPSAPNNARTRANRLRTMQARVRFNRSEPDSVSMSRAVTARNAALQARVPGTPGKVVFRGKNRAANRQNYRANDLTKRIRSDLQYSRPGAFSATAGGGRVGIRRTDTGNRQLAMFGQPAAKLMRTKRVKVNRPSGKSRR